RTAVPSPARVRERIVMTTGSHNMQAYWFETGFTRTTGLLPFTWQVSEQRWISRRSAFVMPPTDPADPTPGAWSFICLKCHATHARPRVEFEGNTLSRNDTHVAEFGIACEACHGPAEDHVASNQNPARRYALHMSGEPDSTIVNPARLEGKRATEVCGQCHGSFDYFVDERHMHTWFRDGFRYRPGEDVQKFRKVKFEGDEQFWSDGLIRVAGREYNAVLGSGCYDRGTMTCLSCHVLHQPSDDTRPRLQWANDQLRDISGDQSCLQCHASYGADIAAHSHHAVDSEGSRCQNCHMPHTTYGLMKGVRTHRIASPSVQSTLATGRPNACNQCHLDQTLEWTASHLHDWYGTEKPQLVADDTEIAASVSWMLKGDAAQRALMAWSLGWGPAQKASGSEWMMPYLAELLDDPYEVVRIIAERSLRTLPGYADFRCDLISAAGARSAAKAAALDIWQKGRPAMDASRRDQVLFGPDGNLRADVFARLLRGRNQRLVRLFE
ncbi:MAG: multiheme c-type cytochrome, partial [Planctomycetota bacterium]